MNALPFGLMLLSASFHATWNLLLKRSDNQEAFVLGIVVSGSVMFVPLGVVLFWLYPIDPPGYLFALVSTGFQSFYFVMLGRAYSRGDLSLIYPVARGIGPMLVPVLAVPLLGETVAWPAAVGIVLIVGGIYVVSWWGRFLQIIARPSRLLRERSVGFAVLAGMAIAGYSLVDKRGVEHVQPFLYMYMQTIGGAIALAPYVVRRHGLATVGREWRTNVRAVLAAGLLVFVAYGLALTAFSLAQVSYMAPARESGIVIGVLLGVFVLKESFGKGRLLGSGFIVGGLALIALSP